MLDSINALLKEHKEHYVSMTRLLIALSATYITITSGIKSDEGYSVLLKLVIVLQSTSLVSGVWLQIVFIKSPLQNIKKFVEHAHQQGANGSNTPYLPKPPVLQEMLFRTQMLTFLVAFMISAVVAIFSV